MIDAKIKKMTCVCEKIDIIFSLFPSATKLPKLAVILLKQILII